MSGGTDFSVVRHTQSAPLLVPFVSPQGWFDWRDWPLASTHDKGPNQWPQTFRSQSGMVFIIDLDDNEERCLQAKSYLFEEWVCMMPRGHDTPHLPMCLDLIPHLGKMIVRSIRSQP